MSFFAGYYSPAADYLYPGDVIRYLCEKTDSPLRVVYDYSGISNTLDFKSAIPDTAKYCPLDRYLVVLPVTDINAFEGLSYTSSGLSEIDDLNSADPSPSVYLKDDGEPDGSIYDRASVLSIALCRDFNCTDVTSVNLTDSSLSMEKSVRETSFEHFILVPETIDSAVLGRISRAENHLLKVDFSADELFEMSPSIVREAEIYAHVPGLNPFIVDSLKTVIYEIVEELGFAPDLVFVPGDDPFVIDGIKKGFSELKTLDWVDSVPTIIEVKYENHGKSDNVPDSDKFSKALIPESTNPYKLSSTEWASDGINQVELSPDEIKRLKSTDSSNDGDSILSKTELLRIAYRKYRKSNEIDGTIVLINPGSISAVEVADSDDSSEVNCIGGSLNSIRQEINRIRTPRKNSNEDKHNE